jgi:hypothetical protein
MAQASHPALAVSVSRAHLHQSFRLWLPLISLAPFPFWTLPVAYFQGEEPVLMTLRGFLQVTFEAFSHDVFRVENPVSAAIIGASAWFLIGFALDELSATSPISVAALLGPAAENSRLLNEVDRQRFLCEMNGEMENAHQVRKLQHDWNPRETADAARTRESAYERILLEAVSGCGGPEIEKRMNTRRSRQAGKRPGFSN